MGNRKILYIVPVDLILLLLNLFNWKKLFFELISIAPYMGNSIVSPLYMYRPTFSQC